MSNQVLHTLLFEPNPISDFVRSALTILLLGLVVYVTFNKISSNLFRSIARQMGLSGWIQFPVIGNLPQLFFHQDYPNFPVVLTKLSKQYGDLLTVKVGKVETVVVSELNAAKRILGHPSVSNRGRDTMMDGLALGQNIGINFANGKVWHDMRGYTMRTLRKFDFGKSAQAPLVLDEARAFVKHLENEMALKGNIRCYDLFDMTIFNLVWKSLGHEGFRMDDESANRMLKVSSDFEKSTNLSVQLAEAFPAIGGLVGGGAMKLAKERLHEIHSFCRGTLQEFQRKSSELDGEVGSFFEDFAARIDCNNNSQDTIFNADQFVVVLIDIFQNAVDGIGGTLTYALLYTMLYPDVKKALQEEIDSAYPEFLGGRTEMRELLRGLQYTQAFILETLRHSSVLPVVAAREPKENIEIDGHHLEKGSSIVVNLYALNNSEKVWQDPENFRPARFLNSYGELDETVGRQVLMFGHGTVGYSVSFNSSSSST